ncbi:MAG TPA: glycosyltransferase family 87 protein [Saprospiraceae bacterium]|nr:glycosyltransferase family 87 protein [Saprospiraceae bacterium]
MHKFLQWITGYRFILFLFIALSIGASVQALLMPLAPIKEGKGDFTAYNNYLIFKQSFYHLINDKDPYIAYPDEHWDLYKYSPAFSILFGFFAMLPDSMGLLLWNGINVIILVLAVFYLPKLTAQQKGLILLACILEIMTSLQNEQSNGLIAGLIIFSFGLCERKRFFLAALCLMLTVFIKLFGIVGFAIFLFYPQKPKLILYTLAWAIFFLLIPLMVVDFGQLLKLYQSWFHLLASDQPPTAFGYSVFGWLESWFQMHVQNMVILAVGALLFLLPFTRTKMYLSYDFRLLALPSILIWVVIFNHMAESPTFIIAMTGVSIWFFTRKPTLINVVLFVMAIILTSLSSSDIFPRDIRNEFIHPYVLKAFPCILIWIKIVIDMMVAKKEVDSSVYVQPTNLNAR